MHASCAVGAPYEASLPTKVHNTTTRRARAERERLQTIYGEKFGVTFGEEDPDENYFLGASRVKEMYRNKHDRKVVSIKATTYIDRMMVSSDLPTATSARARSSRRLGLTHQQTTR
eukprot:7173006-Prymnesium_polylepis.1